ncbi:hypothetical protein [Enterobacter phage ATCEA23]|nr:uncharacterized protein [Enterobacter phage ATCEA85]QQV93498.1 hypothetical protein [Enterobacter phage ATCEA23]
MSEPITHQPKNAVEMSTQIHNALSRGRIPVIIADQPSLAYIVAEQVGRSHVTNLVGKGNAAPKDEIMINSRYSDAVVINHLNDAIVFKRNNRRVMHVVILKADKNGAGLFSGDHFVKIVSKRLFITMGSVANYLVGEA